MPRIFRKPASRRPAPVDRITRGEGGERQLQDWLDRSSLPYLFLDQTPLTIPLAQRSHLKRPDFIVPIAGIGPVAIDAKAKEVPNDEFTLDEYERRTLGAFEAAFGMPVFYAVFPPDQPARAMLFRNAGLYGTAVGFRPDTASLHIPLSRGLSVQHHRVSFAKAILSANIIS